MKTFQSPVKYVTLLIHNMFTILFPVSLFKMNKLLKKSSVFQHKLRFGKEKQGGGVEAKSGRGWQREKMQSWK